MPSSRPRALPVLATSARATESTGRVASARIMSIAIPHDCCMTARTMAVARAVGSAYAGITRPVQCATEPEAAFAKTNTAKSFKRRKAVSHDLAECPIRACGSYCPDSRAGGAWISASRRQTQQTERRCIVYRSHNSPNADRFDNYRDIAARFDSTGTCGHDIRKGDRIGWHPKLKKTQCADCW